MVKAFNPTIFLSLFKKWMNIVVVIVGFFQIIFFPKVENIIGVVIVVLGWLVTNNYIIKRSNLIRFTFSTFLILGYLLTQFALPLIFTLLEGKPLIFNLIIPNEVFTHSLLALFSIIISYKFYNYWRINSGKLLFKKIQFKLYENHFFECPSNSQLWIIGFIGISANLFSRYSTGNSVTGSSESGIIGKFIEGFMEYSYAPLLIPFTAIMKKSFEKSGSTKMIFLFMYILLLVVIGMIANTRGLFMQGLTIVGLVFFLGMLVGQIDYRIFKSSYFIAAIVGLWIVTGPLANLGTAMVIVRSQRGDVSGAQLFIETLNTLQKKEEIKAYRKLALSEIGGDWDENYFDNIFLSRFSNLKYNDLSLVQALKIPDDDSKMFKYSIDRFLSTFPSPIISFFGVKVNKKQVSSASFGDYLYFVAGGENAIGGMRTGHFAGTGIAAFGWFYLAIMGFGFIPLFFLLDLFSLKITSEGKPKILFSLSGLILISFIFTFLGTSTASESIISIFTFILRGWIQIIVLYIIVYKISSFFNNLLSLN